MSATRTRRILRGIVKQVMDHVFGPPLSQKLMEEALQRAVDRGILLRVGYCSGCGTCVYRGLRHGVVQLELGFGDPTPLWCPGCDPDPRWTADKNVEPDIARIVRRLREQVERQRNGSVRGV